SPATLGGSSPLPSRKRIPTSRKRPSKSSPSWGPKRATTTSWKSLTSKGFTPPGHGLPCPFLFVKATKPRATSIRLFYDTWEVSFSEEMQMNSKFDSYRKLLSIAMIATGFYFLFGGHVRGSSDSFALGAEPSIAAIAQMSEGMPTFINAKVESHAAVDSLSNELSRWAKASTDPQWLGYAVPAVHNDRVVCCNGNGDWNGNGCGTCRLEDYKHGDNFTTTSSNKTELEAPRRIVVLYRASAGALNKVRVVS